MSAFERISIERDMVFRDNSDDEMSMMTPVLSGSVADGYKAEVMAGIAA